VPLFFFVFLILSSHGQ